MSADHKSDTPGGASRPRRASPVRAKRPAPALLPPGRLAPRREKCRAVASRAEADLVAHPRYGAGDDGTKRRTDIAGVFPTPPQSYASCCVLIVQRPGSGRGTPTPLRRLNGSHRRRGPRSQATGGGHSRARRVIDRSAIAGSTTTASRCPNGGTSPARVNS